MSLLFLNSISGGEIIFVLVLVLLFFGSSSIPKLARGLGKGLRQIKDASQEIQRDIQNSVNDSGEMSQIENDLTKPFKKHQKDIEDSLKD